MRDDVHDGPAGHGGGDVPHHLGDLLPPGVAMTVVEEETGTANTITAIRIDFEIETASRQQSRLILSKGVYCIMTG